jgi:Tol biopolymer transport system component
MTMARIRIGAAAVFALSIVVVGVLTVVANIAADDTSKSTPAAAKKWSTQPVATPVLQGPGKIYIIMQASGEKPQESKKPGACVIAVDPETGEWGKVVDECEGYPSIAHDGLTIAFVWDNALWTQPIAGATTPKRLLGWEVSTVASSVVWSPDDEHLIIGTGTKSEKTKHSVIKTYRISADGNRVETLRIPSDHCVCDWSADGEWVLTMSRQNAKNDVSQVYLMHPDGTDQRQVTEGGYPYYARLSPDGRQVVYADGYPEERRGVWVVGADGKDRRRIVPTGWSTAFPCWSPDGKRIAIWMQSPPDGQRLNPHLEIMDLQDDRRVSLTLPEGAWCTLDWR